MSGVLIFCDYYFPGHKGGGPQHMIKILCQHLTKMGKKPRLITLAHDLGDSTNYQNIAVNAWQETDEAHIYYKDSQLSTRALLLQVLASAKPELIILNGVFSKHFTIPVLFARKTWNQTPFPSLAIFPHGEFSPWALQQKWLKKKVFLAISNLSGLHKNVRWLATTEMEKQWLLGRGLQAKVLLLLPQNLGQQNSSQAHPLDIETTAETTSQVLLLPAAKTHIKVPLHLVFVGRIQRMKNLHFFLELLAQVKCPIKFSIYGPVQDSDKTYWNQCLALIHKLPAHIEVTHHGPIAANQVTKTLAKYSFLVLPSLSENLSFVTAEALSAGLPVILSENVPWNVAENNCGFSLPLTNIEPWISTLHLVAVMSLGEWLQMSKNSREYFQRLMKSSQNSAMIVESLLATSLTGGTF